MVPSGGHGGRFRSILLLVCGRCWQRGPQTPPVALQRTPQGGWRQVGAANEPKHAEGANRGESEFDYPGVSRWPRAGGASRCTRSVGNQPPPHRGHLGEGCCTASENAHLEKYASTQSRQARTACPCGDPSAGMHLKNHPKPSLHQPLGTRLLLHLHRRVRAVCRMPTACGSALPHSVRGHPCTAFADS